jgi:hypothetical protein
MADIYADVVRFTLDHMAATQDIVSANLGGKTPKLAIFWGGNLSSTEHGTNNTTSPFIGFSDGSNTFAVVCSRKDSDRDCTRRGDTNRCLFGLFATTATFYGSFNQWLSTADTGDGTTGVRINVDYANTGKTCFCLLLAGDDVSVASGLATLGVENTVHDITGVGFEPDLVMVLANNYLLNNTTNSGWATQGIGCAHNDKGDPPAISQRAHAVASNQNYTDNSAQYVASDRVSVQVGGTTELVIAYTVKAQDFDSDGFSLKVLDGDSNGDHVTWLAIDLNGGDSWVGDLTLPASTGTLAETGPGFAPEVVFAMVSGCTALDSIAEHGAFARCGFSRDGGKGSYMHMVDEGSSLPDARETWGDKELEMYDEDASAAYTASVTSWDAQGWTFDFTAAVPVTPYLAWGFAIEGAAVAPPASTTGRRRMMVIG